MSGPLTFTQADVRDLGNLRAAEALLTVQRNRAEHDKHVERLPALFPPPLVRKQRAAVLRDVEGQRCGGEHCGRGEADDEHVRPRARAHGSVRRLHRKVMVARRDGARVCAKGIGGKASIKGACGARRLQKPPGRGGARGKHVK